MFERLSFLKAFPFLSDCAEFAGGLDGAYILSATINEANASMAADIFFSKKPDEFELGFLSNRIRREYGLSEVSILPGYPDKGKAKPAAPKEKERLLYGVKPRAKRRTAMKELTISSGKVTVEGDVFAVNNKSQLKGGAAVLNFDITDKSGSVRVNKYLRSDDKDKSVVDLIKKGDRLVVAGEATFSKYEQDLIIDPRGILRVPKPPVRTDDSPEDEKRVELHVHTRFSTQDALTDPAEIVERAAYWGMPAIAVTDHGNAQAFPEMSLAGDKYGVKIIYGLEAYYVNDMDGSDAVIGNCRLGLDSEFVAFDLETTGLKRYDRITEIGAVLFSGGEIKKEFNTLVNPGMHIPAEVSRITGITDSDVTDAPGEAEAVRAFLEFAGDRPLIAHNAPFDSGFIAAAAARSGLKYESVLIDSLPIARALLPGLKNYRLDTVSEHLGLSSFKHHRASDDAMAVAEMMWRFFPLLRARGANRVDEISAACRSAAGIGKLRPKHMVLLVQNRAGLKNLYKMISASYLRFFFSKNPIIPKSLLIQHREGILVGSACVKGELFDKMIYSGATDEQLLEIASFYDYLELQPLCNNCFLIESGKAENNAELEEFNRRVYKIGKKLGKPVVAASDIHFLDPEDEQYRHVLLAAQGFSDADREIPLYFRTTGEMLDEFMYLGEDIAREIVITNPRAIAESVEPIQLLPKGLFPPKIENSAEDLKKLVYDKMHRIYGEKPPQLVQSRVDTELNTILEHNYDVIYMSAQKLVQNSLENGYLVGSRGSVGSSIVAFMSGITEVNSLPPHYVCPNCCKSEFITDGSYGCGADMPEKKCPECGSIYRRDGFDIPFETFLGFPGNEKTPDIDLNFSGEYQASAHKYTETLFGSDHVFRAGTIGTLAEKTAIGYVKKYLELKADAGGKEDASPEVIVTKAEINRLAQGLLGVKRTTGQHPGGLVIIPQDMDVTDFCPVQHPADDPNSEIITTHFEYRHMEDNLLKLDELGHDDPTMIRMMEDMTDVDATEILLSDEDTMSIFTSPAALGLPEDDPIIGKTGTIGVPEFGTGFTRQMLVDTKPSRFNTLIRLSGFSHGTDVWSGNIHDLIVKGVAGVDETVGCRDDIMLYLISKGMEASRAFQFMEAIRKGAIHKGKSWPEGIVGEMRAMGVPEWWIDSCRKIQYLFPKAHAVAYVMMAFRIAWFKVHRPFAFYSAYFYRRCRKGGFDAEMMCGGAASVRRKIEDMRRRSGELGANEGELLTTLEAVYEFNMRGFSFERIDLYESDALKFLPVDEKKLRPPFLSVPGLGEAAAQDLFRCSRSGREFISIEELGRACPKVSRTALDILKSMGALGNMPESSQTTLFDM